MQHPWTKIICRRSRKSCDIV